MAQDTLLNMLVSQIPDDPDQTTTVLSPDDDDAFNQWVAAHKDAKHRWAQNIDHPHDFYDYRGFWKEHGNVEMGLGQHFPDRYKQPGHITFSSESKYASPENPGGTWEPGTDIYLPGDGRRIDMADEKTRSEFEREWKEAMGFE
tara:strand:- start:394 stop:825 length:432 start_codon:yes stop_codon:yes gene_type:complete